MGRQTFLPIEILDYIETHERSTEEAFGIGQQELAKNLGYHACSMSRPLQELVGNGWLVAARGLVRGGRRKHVTYRLTPAGVAHLRKETRDVPLLGRGVPPPPAPFLGRKEELEALARSAPSDGGVTVVEGPAGMGKSALLAVHVRRSERGRVVFWFRVGPSSTPREFVSGLAHVLSFSGKPQLAYYAQLPRNPVAKEVADLARRALGKRSLAAVIDDLHVASDEMRGFVAEVVTTLRTSGAHQFYLLGQSVTLPAGLEASAKRLRVGGLDRAAAFELTGRQGGLADRFEQVFRSTLGSPLYLKLAASNPTVEATPATLPAAVVRQLTADDLRVVLPVALASEPLPATFVAEESRVPLTRIPELVRTGVLYARADGRVEIMDVVRTAVFGRADGKDEQAAHLALARFYGRSHRPEAIRERFLHLVLGEDLLSASHLLEEHQQVLLRLGFSDGLRQALRHLSTGLPRGSARQRALMAEAALLRHHSEFAESIRTLRRVVAESEPNSSIGREAGFGIVEQLLRLGQTEEAFAEFEKARSLAGTSRRLQVFARLTEARIEEARGHSAVAFDLYQEAFDLSQRARAQDLGLEAIAAWSRLAELTRGPEVALRVVGDALPRARQANRMDVVLNLLLVRARAYWETGRNDLAETEMRAIQSEAESLGYLNQLAYTLSGLAAVAVEKSRWVEASGYARQAIATAERIGNDLVLGHTLAVLCASETRQALASNDPRLADSAFGYGQRSVEVLRRLPLSESLLVANAYLADVCLFRNDLASARKYYSTALELGHQLNARFLVESLRSDIGRRLGLEDRDAPEALPQ